MQDYFTGPMWHWFGLSYAAYLVLPRALICGMPEEWQARFAAMLNEMREVYNSDKIEDNYMVKLRGKKGKFTDDPLANYRHPPLLPYSTAGYKENLV